MWIGISIYTIKSPVSQIPIYPSNLCLEYSESHRKPEPFVASCSRLRHSQPTLDFCSYIALTLIYFKLCVEVLALMITFRAHSECGAVAFTYTFLILGILYLVEKFLAR